MVPVPVGDVFAIYHILQNGSDTSDCGSSVESACFSLLYVLMLYYAQPPTKGLELRIDKSIFVDSSLMVRLFSKQF